VIAALAATQALADLAFALGPVDTIVEQGEISMPPRFQGLMGCATNP
jgi:hypothetical protein